MTAPPTLHETSDRMGKTIDIAANRAADQTRTVIPAELARDFYVTNAPSLAALKLFHLMIGTAAGRMADDTRHQIRMAALKQLPGMRNHDRATLTPLFEELRGVVVRHGDPTMPQRVDIGGLIESARLEAPDTTNDTLISWRFDALFRDIAAKSDHWAILDRQTIFHMQSKYSVLLFQHISSYENFQHIHSKEFTVPQLRALLGIPHGKIARFSSLTREVLAPAIAEINQLSRLDLTASSTKTGRTVTKVTIQWQAKPDPEPTKRELAASKIGRTARRNGTAETPAPAFPASGSIAYVEPWRDLKRAAGCNLDNTEVADKFRSWCAKKGIALDSPGIAKRFTDYCRSIGRV